MAKIVLVHGAFNEHLGPYEVRARWLPALRDGLWHQRVQIEDDDVDVCFYGDLFRRRPGTPEYERLQRSRAEMPEVLAHLSGDAIAALGQAANDAAYDRTIDMITTLTEPDLREHVRARIDSAVANDTRVIVAHSLGSVLAYAGLCRHPDWPVATFVTMGSPLAMPLVLKVLEQGEIDGKAEWPGPVVRWVNVRAVGDRTADLSLRDAFGQRVEEFLIDNGDRAHAPEHYLSASVTGDAIASGLTG